MSSVESTLGHQSAHKWADPEGYFLSSSSPSQVSASTTWDGGDEDEKYPSGSAHSCALCCPNIDSTDDTEFRPPGRLVTALFPCRTSPPAASVPLGLATSATLAFDLAVALSHVACPLPSAGGLTAAPVAAAFDPRVLCSGYGFGFAADSPPPLPFTL